MSASLFFILMGVIYLSHDLHPNTRRIMSVLCLVTAVCFALTGK